MVYTCLPTHVGPFGKHGWKYGYCTSKIWVHYGCSQAALGCGQSPPKLCQHEKWNPTISHQSKKHPHVQCFQCFAQISGGTDLIDVSSSCRETWEATVFYPWFQRCPRMFEDYPNVSCVWLLIHVDSKASKLCFELVVSGSVSKISRPGIQESW